MCAGAMIQARIARLVYGCDDPKGGAVRSCFAIFDHPALNHRVVVTAACSLSERPLCSKSSSPRGVDDPPNQATGSCAHSEEEKIAEPTTAGLLN